jgi:hypothetical protein
LLKLRAASDRLAEGYDKTKSGEPCVTRYFVERYRFE